MNGQKEDKMTLYWGDKNLHPARNFRKNPIWKLKKLSQFGNNHLYNKRNSNNRVELLLRYYDHCLSMFILVSSTFIFVTGELELITWSTFNFFPNEWEFLWVVWTPHRLEFFSSTLLQPSYYLWKYVLVE